MANSTSKMLARMTSGSKSAPISPDAPQPTPDSANPNEPKSSPEMEFLLNNILGLGQSKKNTPMD